MAQKRDFYDVLSVKKDATAAQIKSAYRKLARKYHPDVNKDDDATKKFQEASEAYEVLSDTKKRQTYDQFGMAAFTQGAAGGGGAPPGWGGGMGGGGQRVNVNFADIFGGGGTGDGFAGMGLDDILEALGGGTGRRSARGRTRGPAPKGQDVGYRVMLDFLQAIRGTELTLKVDSQNISVKIPAGVKDGQKIRLRGKGHPGPGGSGDLLIECKIRKHLYFCRDGNDISVEVPISITEAALGAKVDVPTIDGTTTVKIPAGVASGRRLRLKEKGVLPAGKDKTRGDQYVTIKIAPPEKLSKEARELLEKFDKKNHYDPRAEAPWK